jgi:large subunit ribosomal protein L11
MIMKLLVDGGNMKPGPAVAQKLGPVGINMGKLISDINNSTKEFVGIKVPVSVDVDTKTKSYKIEVSTPSAAEMLKKEFALEKGSGQPHKLKLANAAIEQLIKIAKMKETGMLSKDFKSTLKTIIGSCVSLGILVESKDPKIVSKEIEKGIYDKLISEGKTTVSPEKTAQLEAYFATVKKAQEELMRKEEEEKKAKEEAAAAAAPAAAAAGAAAPAAAAAGKAPAAAAAATTPAAPTKEAKPKAKK